MSLLDALTILSFVLQAQNLPEIKEVLARLEAQEIKINKILEVLNAENTV